MHKKLTYFSLCFIVLVLAAAAYTGYCLKRNLPPVKPVLANNLSYPSTASQLAWPAQGESAVGVAGTNIMSTYGNQTPLPTASTAKMVTALMILKAKPLSLGEQGPTITLNQSDVAIYANYLSEDGSCVQVVNGEQISEYQMLEGMLLPSANNMADSLAIWAYGSLPNYASAANQYVSGLGLSGTHIGSDASGFLPNTVSTASNLVKIGEMVMQNPVLKQIVSEPSASGIPVVNNIKNVNYLLGKDGIVGIKTGNSDQAGGVFVGAANVMVGNKLQTVITANMGEANLVNALNYSHTFIVSAEHNFSPETIVKSGTVVGYYYPQWLNHPVTAVASSDFSIYAWDGNNYGVEPALNNLSYPMPSGSVVGHIKSTGEEVSGSGPISAITTGYIAKPSLAWRLLHP